MRDKTNLLMRRKKKKLTLNGQNIHSPLIRWPINYPSSSEATQEMRHSHSANTFVMNEKTSLYCPRRMRERNENSNIL